jgi:hypothetical protein
MCPSSCKPDHLKIEPDHVLADMLRAMHLIVTEAKDAFEPEGGAYAAGGHGHGHTAMVTITTTTMPGGHGHMATITRRTTMTARAAHDDTTPLTAASLLQLIWLASPALPVGGFSYSEGLEASGGPGLVKLTKRRRPTGWPTSCT